jgi:hypothetical protein
MLIISSANAQNSITGMSPEREKIELQIIRLEKQLEKVKYTRDSLEIVELNKNLKVDEATITYIFNCQTCQYDKATIKFNESLCLVKVNVYLDGKVIKKINYTKDEKIQIPIDKIGWIELELFMSDGTPIKVVKKFES